MHPTLPCLPHLPHLHTLAHAWSQIAGEAPHPLSHTFSTHHTSHFTLTCKTSRPRVGVPGLTPSHTSTHLHIPAEQHTPSCTASTLTLLTPHRPAKRRPGSPSLRPHSVTGPVSMTASPPSTSDALVAACMQPGQTEGVTGSYKMWRGTYRGVTGSHQIWPRGGKQRRQLRKREPQDSFDCPNVFEDRKRG